MNWIEKVKLLEIYRHVFRLLFSDQILQSTHHNYQYTLCNNPKQQRLLVPSERHLTDCSTMSVDNYNYILHNNPGKQILQLIIIKSFYSVWSRGHPWRASRHCGLQLSPWPRSMIFLCFLSHPLLSFATFSLAYLSFYIPKDSNLMQLSLLLLFLYVMCVQSNSIFYFLSDYLLKYFNYTTTKA